MKHGREVISLPFLMRLGYQEPTGELKTVSRIIPIAERIGIGSIPRCLRRNCLLRLSYNTPLACGGVV
jgi:hypothetical protein